MTVGGQLAIDLGGFDITDTVQRHGGRGGLVEFDMFVSANVKTAPVQNYLAGVLANIGLTAAL